MWIRVGDEDIVNLNQSNIISIQGNINVVAYFPYDEGADQRGVGNPVLIKKCENLSEAKWYLSNLLSNLDD